MFIIILTKQLCTCVSSKDVGIRYALHHQITKNYYANTRLNTRGISRMCCIHHTMMCNHVNLACIATTVCTVMRSYRVLCQIRLGYMHGEKSVSEQRQLLNLIIPF